MTVAVVCAYAEARTTTSWVFAGADALLRFDACEGGLGARVTGDTCEVVVVDGTVELEAVDVGRAIVEDVVTMIAGVVARSFAAAPHPLANVSAPSATASDRRTLDNVRAVRVFLEVAVFACIPFLLGTCDATPRENAARTTPSTSAYRVTAPPQPTGHSESTVSIANSTSSTVDVRPEPFAASVTALTSQDLRHTYRPGCPVGPAGLRAVHLTFVGFDRRTHHGVLVVAATIASSVVRVFHTLYDTHFPIRSMRPVDAFVGSDDESMAADNTSAFNCRDAVAQGPARWSAHAYGLAIDVNPVENPYLENGHVLPPNGATFVDRTSTRPGMAIPNSDINNAFAAAGWQWGGRWSAPDYQHFSTTGG